jgi:hypothetical protein
MKRVGYLAALSGERRAEGPPALKPPRRLFAHEPAVLDELLWVAEPAAGAPAPIPPRQAQAVPRAPAATSAAEHSRPERPPAHSPLESAGELVQRPRAPSTQSTAHRPRAHTGREKRQLEPPSASTQEPASSAERLRPSVGRRPATEPASVSRSAAGSPDASPSPPPTARPQAPLTHPEHTRALPRARQGTGAARDSDPRSRDTTAAHGARPGLRPATTLEHRSRRPAPSGLEPPATAPGSRAPSRRAPRLHIGKIEVTVTAPVAATTPPRPQPRAGAPRRQSTASAAIGAPRWFGFAQR